jgi:hypothetical protein
VLIHLEKDAARLLHISPRTLQRYRQTGVGPKFVRRGMRGIGYTDQALTDWISQRTYPSVAAERASAKQNSHGDG